MPSTLDHVLDQRLHRITRHQRRHYLVASVLGHALLTVGFFWLPKLFDKPPETFDYVAVTVVPPQALGDEQPAPPPPPSPEPEPVPQPPPPEPAAEPPEPDRPVLVDEKKTPEKQEPEETTPEPRPAPPPEPAAEPSTPSRDRPSTVPRRRGSPFGDPLGSTQNTAIGVEDPNFTYGYYLDRVAAMISGNWSRPPVGGEVVQAVLYFRIQKDGEVTDLRVAETSGSEVFDRTALAAVEASSPLPPLPKSYRRDRLGINLIIR